MASELTHEQQVFQAEILAGFLTRKRAHLVINVCRIVRDNPGYRGKVKLGDTAGAKGDNSRCARPVEKAEAMGLLRSTRDGGAYVYRLTDCGQRVLAVLDEEG